MTRLVRKGAVDFRVAATPRYDEFWDWFESDDWEPETVAVLGRLLEPESTYLDLGAWIGPTVLLAAKACARVVCVEPDPVAREELCRNLGLNPDVEHRTAVHGFAVAAEDGTATMSADRAGGSLSTLIASRDAQERWQVRAVAIAPFLASSEASDATLIKIDVEGAEYELVPAMAEYIGLRRPSIFLATHPNVILDKSSLATRLTSGLRALVWNRRMLRVLLSYSHHYVYDPRCGGFVDIRRRNVLRVLLPLPLRRCFLIGACLFTQRTLV